MRMTLVALSQVARSEFDENFTITLSGASDSQANHIVEIETATATGLILNDDTSVISIGDIVVQEPDVGNSTEAVFTLTLSDAASQTVSVNVTTSDGTATTANGDFVSTTRTVFFSAGDTTATFSVDITGDDVIELDENFFVTISNPTFAGDSGDATLLTGGPGADGDATTGVAQVEIIDTTAEATINNDEAFIEFVESGTQQGEDGAFAESSVFAVNGVPTLVVSGDLTGTSQEERTIEIQFLSGNSTAIRDTPGTNGDFILGTNPFTAAEFVIPALNFSAIEDGGLGATTFDLTLVDQFGDLASETGLAPILTILNDGLVEGTESLELEIQQLTTVVNIGDADGDSDLNTATTQIIVDNDVETTVTQAAGIFLNSTQFSAEFRDLVDGSSTNDPTFGFELTPENIDLTIPFININEIVIDFDEAVDVSSLDISDFAISGVVGTVFDAELGLDVADLPVISSVAIDSNDASAVRLSLSSAFEAAIVDLEINASGITFDGVSGSDFAQQFSVLPGDIDSSGGVLTTDAFSIIPSIGSTIGDANYDFRADVDGSGTILTTDLFAVLDRLGDALPALPPVFTVSAPSASTGINVPQVVEENSSPEATLDDDEKDLNLSSTTTPSAAPSNAPTEGQSSDNLIDRAFENFGTEDDESEEIDVVVEGLIL